jgi:hypothetical protein
MYQSRFGLSREPRDLEEPGVVVGRVVGDEVEDDFQPLAVRLAEQGVKVDKRAEER